MSSFGARARQHDTQALNIVIDAFRVEGFRNFVMGTESDSPELQKALRQQHDRTSIMLRYRPDQLFIKPAARTVLCEVKSEEWLNAAASRTTLGWRPTCACPPHQPVPCVVLDPFGGSGTTGIAADRLGRDAILVELKPEYAALAERRLNRDAPLLMWGAVSLEGATDTEGETEGEAAPLAPGGKQASHPNRTVQGFNARWAAKQKAGEDAAG